jgi:hypothetical protein
MYLMINIVCLLILLPNTGSVGTLTPSSGGVSAAATSQHALDQKAEEAKKEGELYGWFLCGFY